VIVRIMGQGQLQVAEEHLDQLNELDDAVTDAVDAGDEQRFAQNLARLIDQVRAVGSPVADDYLGGSDFILPDPASSLAEVRALLGDEGLVPG
jgi:hypothetical protein